MLNEGILAEQFIGQHLLYRNHGIDKPYLYYWLREGKKHNAEVDFVITAGKHIVPVEVKSGKTVNQSFFDGLHYWCDLAGVDREQGYVVYAGAEAQSKKTGTVVGWQFAADILNSR